MMHRRLGIFIFVLTFSFTVFGCQSVRKTAVTESDEKAARKQNFESGKTANRLHEIIPVDPAVTVGTLQNGFTYYVRENQKPSNRAVLRLVVNAGSVLEDENEQGLAHFVEHMAFNGTEHFKKTEVIDYLESLGIRYGPDVNATTSFDETVYMLEIPTDDLDAMDKGFRILAEWAYLVSFEEEEVDRERGIIIEEWRQRSGARMRIMERHYPVLFRGSKYSKRLPIGKIDIIKNAHSADLKGFYKKWYRPDLMAVIAVGDFRAEYVEKIIKRLFSNIPVPEHAPKRILFPVPDHEKTLYSVVRDPEATESTVGVYMKHGVRKTRTVKDYRNNIVEYLFTGMLNNRLDEIVKKPDPPFTSAGTGRVAFVRTKEAVILQATVPEGGIERGLETLLIETKRAQVYGFTQSELEREKKNILRLIEQYYLERDNTPSQSFASEYLGHFLEGEPIPGIEYEYELFNLYIPKITLEEVNSLAEKWITKENRVVLVSAPEKQSLTVPGEDELELVFQRVKTASVSPYEDAVKQSPLIEEKPDAGSIVKEIFLKDTEVTQWILSNGAKVYFKPTRFKQDEILFEAMSPGGHSLVGDGDYIAAITAPTAVRDSGIGNFSLTELEKRLAGKVVELTPWIGEVYEGMSGSASPRDIETLLQLVYLVFTDPRKDPDAFLAYRERLRTRFLNRRSDPQEVFWDTVRSALQQDHFRSRPLSVEILDEMNLDRSYALFRERFSNAADFSFIFVGNFDIDSIRPHVLTYIGGLPSTGTDEHWRDLCIDPPDGVVEERVFMGIEPKSQVQIVFSDSFVWSVESDFALEALAEVLDMRLREKVREEQSGTYGIWVFSSTQKYPDNEYSVYIGFGCDPDRVDELTEVVFQEIDWIRKGAIDDIYLQKTRKLLIGDLEKAQKENEYWLNSIATTLRRNQDLSTIAMREKLIRSLDAETISDAARRALTPDQYIRVVLYPEQKQSIQ
jgi:zinc protease